MPMTKNKAKKKKRRTKAQIQEARKKAIAEAPDLKSKEKARQAWLKGRGPYEAKSHAEKMGDDGGWRKWVTSEAVVDLPAQKMRKG